MSSQNENVIKERSSNGRFLRYSEQIGRGAYKDVYRGFDTMEGKVVAWNSVSIISFNDKEKESLRNEIKHLHNFNNECQYIVDFYASWYDKMEKKVVMITEIALSGTLKSFINEMKEIKLKALKKWCKQLMLAIDYIHSQKIVHRDIKCDNIFINGNTGNILLGDFGLSLTRKGTEITSVVGTPEFMAPEMYEGKYSDKIDVYAFGMTMLEIATKKIPYYECNFVPQIWRKITSGRKPLIYSHLKECKLKKIISQCIDPEPLNRPSIKELMDFDFFNNNLEDEITLDNFIISEDEKIIIDVIDDLINKVM